MAKKIVLTGGGTAGHVTPNIALLPALKEAGYEIYYIGSKDGIEKKLIADYDIPYHGVSSGKLRRYLDIKNLTDPSKVINGYFEARIALRKIKPDIVFSKGGYVSVPIVAAAQRLRIPTIIHESDITPGLANKICMPLAKAVCCNFPETMEYVPEGKGVLTGTPIRAELSKGSKDAGLSLCGFSNDKPVLMIIGGSQGSRAVNACVRESLDMLLERFQVVHLCGKGNLDESLEGKTGYKQFEYIKEELKDIFAAADIVISRAGANAICEILSIRKPNLLIPLPTSGSRGDQLLNAKSFESQGYSMVLREEDMTKESLVEAVNKLYDNRDEFIKAMGSSSLADPIKAIMDLIEKYKKDER